MLGDKANRTRNFKNMVSKSSFTVLLINWYIIIKPILIQSSKCNGSFRNTRRHFKNNAFCPSFTFICHLNTDFFPHRKKRKFYHVFNVLSRMSLLSSQEMSLQFPLPGGMIYRSSSFRQNKVGYGGTTHLLHITSFLSAKRQKKL